MSAEYPGIALSSVDRGYIRWNAIAMVVLANRTSTE